MAAVVLASRADPGGAWAHRPPSPTVAPTRTVPAIVPYPPGSWLRSGVAGVRDGMDYEVGVDRTGGAVAPPSGYVRARHEAPQSAATLMQWVRADAYRGERLRLSAAVRTAGVAESAGLWLRVDERDSVLALDNMHRRPVTGTQPWGRHAVVLDVPAEAVVIAFGVLLRGPGQVWVDDFRLEAVGPDVAPTAPPNPPDRPREPGRWTGEAIARLASQPANLDFSRF